MLKVQYIKTGRQKKKKNRLLKELKIMTKKIKSTHTKSMP